MTGSVAIDVFLMNAPGKWSEHLSDKGVGKQVFSFNSATPPTTGSPVSGKGTHTEAAGLMSIRFRTPLAVPQNPVPVGLVQPKPGSVSTTIAVMAARFGEKPTAEAVRAPREPSALDVSSHSWFSIQLAEEKLQLHNAGRCHPCVAFALRADGCWKGDDCSHCHFCTAATARTRRSQLQTEARRRRRRARRIQQLAGEGLTEAPENQVEEDEEEGIPTPDPEAILTGQPFWI
mmetsp:Transcript_21238/g.49415  ORF Transcript_21238/g.49415 Transcript_21238/m.49415 type:complete len:232 (+) Transcript_21238:36-731(+)